MSLLYFALTFSLTFSLTCHSYILPLHFLLHVALIFSSYIFLLYFPLTFSSYIFLLHFPLIFSSYIFLLYFPLIFSSYIFLSHVALIFSSYIFLSHVALTCRSCFSLCQGLVLGHASPRSDRPLPVEGYSGASAVYKQLRSLPRSLSCLFVLLCPLSALSPRPEPSLDLDSLLDSSDDCPDSPYSPDAVPAPCPQPDLTSALTLESPEGAVKSEPLSPALSPELGSEVELGQDLVEGPSHSHSDSDSDSGIESSPPHTPQSCKSKPYSRPQPDTKPSRPLKPVKTVEKKLKKMEQNKTAATRYRQKKRVEQEELNAERLLLEQKNQELSERAQALSKEIQYLKDLMEEVRRHHQSKTRTATK
uniref:Cyclic AMP-dependent transcription factor ATF-4 n=1 Tax=Periophthalmus magnuspinnatus TaxID=409849 RepID=A0A3B4B2C1_9GOBI